MPKQKARIEEWAIVDAAYSGYAKPEDLVRPVLTGNVYGHPNHPHIIEGEPISTSLLQHIDFERMVAITKNTEYELGVGPAEDKGMFVARKINTAKTWNDFMVEKGFTIQDYVDRVNELGKKHMTVDDGRLIRDVKKK